MATQHNIKYLTLPVIIYYLNIELELGWNWVDDRSEKRENFQVFFTYP
jgi:hypothetical protein